MTAMTATRPNVRKARNAQQAYDEANAYMGQLIERLQALRESGAGRQVNGDWGHAGTVHHRIDLLLQALGEE